MIRTAIGRALSMVIIGVVLSLGSGTTVEGQTFTATGDLMAPRTFHTATLLPDGRVLIAGGSDAGVTAELFDPTIAAFVPAGSLTITRTLHSTTLLNTGQVLLVGGVGSGPSAELFDPTTGTFTPTSPLTAARSSHTATLLPDGTVLIAGGTGQDGLPLATAELYDQATGTFTQTSFLTTARTSHTATVLTNGQVLITGGAGETATATTELYDPVTALFTPTSAMGTARSNHTATLLSNGQVLITGGAGLGNVSLSTAELFDPTIGTFRPTGSLGTTRSNHTATLLSTGQVLVAGNFDGGTTAELFDPTTGAFSQTASMTMARTFHTATRLPNGQVLFAGGFGGSTTAEQFELPVSTSPEVAALEGSFRATGSMTVARQSHTATLLSTGQVLVAGGLGGGAAAALFDPAAETFSATGAMTVARQDHTAVALTDGRVLVAGGSGAGATVELYDPATQAFTATGGLATARSRHTATLLADGRVLLAGGLDQTGFALPTAEIFESSTGAFTATGDLTTARSNHTATQLPDGRVLLAGGLDQNGFVLPTAEIFESSTGAFTATGSLTTARSNHTATLLADGRVLIAGGTGAGATAELFDPTTGISIATSTMTTARELHTATLLPSGQVLLAGGVFGAETAEVFDPAAVSFTAIGNLTMARQLHTATLLPNGPVLITGGIGILATAELFARSIPDLSVTITKAKLKAKGLGNKLTVKVSISNRGAESATGPFVASLFLSADETLDAQDTLLQTITLNKKGTFKAGKTKKKKFKVLGLGSIVGMFTIVDIDPVAGEENTINNTGAQVISGTVPIILTITRAGSGSGVVSSNPDGIACGTVCTGSFASNTAVLLSATADPGSVFTGWSGDACNVALISADALSGSCQFVPLVQNRSVIATFEIEAAAAPGGLTLTVATTGSGTVTSTPGGIACGTDCTETFAPGSVVILQTTPNPGSIFVGWTGGGCNAFGTGACNLTMTQSQTVFAQFTTSPIGSTFALTVAKSGTGSGTVTSIPAGISCGLDCSEDFSSGLNISLQAVATGNSAFTGWSGAGCSGATSCIVPMTQNQTVTAQFTSAVGSIVILTVTEVRPIAGAAGTIAGTGITCGNSGALTDCSESIATGTSLLLTATAASGSTFVGWGGGGCSGTFSCTVNMTHTQTVIAVFDTVLAAPAPAEGDLKTLAVAKVGTGSGTVTGGGIVTGSTTERINCGTDCVDAYPELALVTLSATPDAGSTFGGFSGGGCTGTAPVCVVDLISSAIVTATFN